ncbi:anthranilate synthase component II [Bythopirellula polymerisocia]|uniref:Aminodeoxychorismate synthase component 2 n=1 Tax=Bythopirellula polymerisocia TaxID=2528003 RepID=A0A5C6CHQ7_9BACT|nr:aminodeoxychorismate/anthranilate synthase component II [Bythopirellula polymerisocia]TWU22811.1 Aminodeoxychorismate synthase component 2 [Bythopirellula polymerisocia]
MILLIDNYDSFVHNLARYFRRLGQETLVIRNDVLTVQEITRLAPQAIVISPGPGTPHDAGISVDLVRRFRGEIPILGVCLGHQAIASAFGATIVRAKEPMHGRTSLVSHLGTPLFRQIPSPLTVCRYHSLIVDPITLPDELAVTAQSEDGTAMAIKHAQYPLVGVQFHPEATLTGFGFRLLANFLKIAGIGIDIESEIEQLSKSEFRFADRESVSLPVVPVTF